MVDSSPNQKFAPKLGRSIGGSAASGRDVERSHGCIKYEGCVEQLFKAKQHLCNNWPFVFKQQSSFSIRRGNCNLVFCNEKTLVSVKFLNFTETYKGASEFNFTEAYNGCDSTTSSGRCQVWHQPLIDDAKVNTSQFEEFVFQNHLLNTLVERAEKFFVSET